MATSTHWTPPPAPGWKTYLGASEAEGCGQKLLGVSSAAAVQDGVLYVGGGQDDWYALDASTARSWQIYIGDSASGE